MSICVEIMVGDDGTFSVKQCEPREEMGEEAGQQVASLDEALQAAEMILVGDSGGQEEEQAFTKGMGDMMGGTTPPANPRGGM